MATATRSKNKTDTATAEDGGAARPTTRIGRMATAVATKSKALAASAEELAGACLASGGGAESAAATRGRKRSG